MADDEDVPFVVAVFPDGSWLRRYSRSREYWHESSPTKTISAERLSMKIAADRAVWREAEVVPGVAAAKKFYAAVEKAKAEWLETRIGWDD